MGGIFGLVDPGGGGAHELAHQLLRAAGAVDFRGQPAILAEPPAAFGAFSREGVEAPVVQIRGQLLAAHATVYDGDSEESPPVRLERLISSGLGQDLNDVCADFAVAAWDMRRHILTLARDAMGVRPLFYSRMGRRIAFASDPEILFVLGASDELDPIGVGAYLLGAPPAERTAFRGIRRLAGGHLLRVEPQGALEIARWYQPIVRERSRPLGEAAEELRDALNQAVKARAARGRTALLLSGGWDSGAIARTLGRLEMEAVCITQSYDAASQPSEVDRAREIAAASGLPIVEAPVPVDSNDAEVERLPRIFGTPAGFPLFPVPLSSAEYAAAEDVDVVMSGDGGEMFAGYPVAVWDLLRAGRLRSALVASNQFSTSWFHPPWIQLKAAARATSPSSLLRLRELARPIPPWVRRVRGVGDALPVGRSARDQLRLSLIRAGNDTTYEMYERLYARSGIEWTAPLLDARVIRVALSLPVDLLIPIPTPKPVLSVASLGGFSANRTKLSYVPYMVSLARSVRRRLPHVFSENGFPGAHGAVIATGLPFVSSPRWEIDSLALVPLYAWLNRGKDG